ncbi:DNA polymerase IV [Bacteroidia bacterium]|nr:DNA polymerase IV [Bacteroidia bacterium]
MVYNNFIRFTFVELLYDKSIGLSSINFKPLGMVAAVNGGSNMGSNMGSNKDRTILHCDMNSFYASVACFVNPELRDKPVVVGGSEDLRHGIVLAKNEIAKRYGIKTSEVLWLARNKCPGLVTAPPDYELYLKFSRLAREIYSRYTDRIESFGIDECWVDVTGSTNLFGSGEKIANEIREVVKRELGVTVSAGVSFSKIFSKLGSDMKKPDATTVITRENFRDKVWRLPASDLLYVGHATANKLSKMGIETIGQLANADVERLVSVLGAWGLMLSRFANGEDNSPVAQNGEEGIIKSVGNSTTLPRNIETVEDVKKVFYMLSESVASRLRDHGLKATTVQIYVRDEDLASVERQGQLRYPSFLSGELAEKSMEIFIKKYVLRKPIRSLGVRGCNLVGKDAIVQLDLFADHAKRERHENLEYAIDDLRRRFGYHIVERGILHVDRDLTKINPKDHTIHPINFFDGPITTDYTLKRSA